MGLGVQVASFGGFRVSGIRRAARSPTRHLGWSQGAARPRHPHSTTLETWNPKPDA
ncbi:MAG: hypothetical protein AVDCRST_MAG03-3397 [uncultured Rubrobacteraceae bacterium]|uniref:Uncharacterized protein n=1 Tax=uncultured Rubrobacteraceae bacterium TaxID=349277 RepID=A0A6J4QBA9_9ACTN|nr:MAG: hypothetical protein AVDCRST_MAG03-3397 [uncultured Rubrobacteraceae bacterium]